MADFSWPGSSVLDIFTRHEDVQRCTEMYKLSGIYWLYQFTDSWHPLRSDVLHFYLLLLVLCFIWADPSTFRLQRLHSGKLKHQSSELHSLRPDFDFESDSHFPPSPLMSTFIFKACAVQNKSPESSPPPKKNNSTLHDSKVYYTSPFILNLPAATPLLLHSISLLPLCNCLPLQSTCITRILCAYFHHSLLSLCNCLLLQHTSITQPYRAIF